MYCIVNKIEFINNNVVYTPVGYLTNMVDCESINNKFENTYNQWIIDNKTDLENNNISISQFFDTTPVVYLAEQRTESVEGMNLNEILDTSEMI